MKYLPYILPPVHCLQQELCPHFVLQLVLPGKDGRHICLFKTVTETDTSVVLWESPVICCQHRQDGFFHGIPHGIYRRCPQRFLQLPPEERYLLGIVCHSIHPGHKTPILQLQSMKHCLLWHLLPIQGDAGDHTPPAHHSIPMDIAVLYIASLRYYCPGTDIAVTDSIPECPASPGMIWRRT